MFLKRRLSAKPPDGLGQDVQHPVDLLCGGFGGGEGGGQIVRVEVPGLHGLAVGDEGPAVFPAQDEDDDDLLYDIFSDGDQDVIT